MTCLAVVGFSVGARTQVRDFTPVTDEALRRPDPGDWINWRRTSDGWGYSPLNSINRQNVGQLRRIWSAEAPTGAGQETPLVYRGVMYWPITTGIRRWTPQRERRCGN